TGDPNRPSPGSVAAAARASATGTARGASPAGGYRRQRRRHDGIRNAGAAERARIQARRGRWGERSTNHRCAEEIQVRQKAAADRRNRRRDDPKAARCNQVTRDWRGVEHAAADRCVVGEGANYLAVARRTISFDRESVTLTQDKVRTTPPDARIRR